MFRSIEDFLRFVTFLLYGHIEAHPCRVPRNIIIIAFSLPPPPPPTCLEVEKTLENLTFSAYLAPPTRPKGK